MTSPSRNVPVTCATSVTLLTHLDDELQLHAPLELLVARLLLGTPLALHVPAEARARAADAEEGRKESDPHDGARNDDDLRVAKGSQGVTKGAGWAARGVGGRREGPASGQS